MAEEEDATPERRYREFMESRKHIVRKFRRERMRQILEDEKWAMHHPWCRNCQTTEIPHKGRGYCERCYAYLRRRGELDDE